MPLLDGPAKTSNSCVSFKVKLVTNQWPSKSRGTKEILSNINSVHYDIALDIYRLRYGIAMKRAPSRLAVRERSSLNTLNRLTLTCQSDCDPLQIFNSQFLSMIFEMKFEI